VRIGVDGRELQGLPTGAGRYLRNLLRAWPGRDQIFLYFQRSAPPDPVLARPGIVIRPVGTRAERGLLWQERTLPRAARADALDVFFAPAYFCPLRLDVPRVTTIHDMAPFSVVHDFSVREALRRRLLLGLSIGASRRILTVSEFSAREIALHFPAAAHRVRAIHEAADTELPSLSSRDDARARLDVRGPMLLSVGSILNRRNLPVLLEAVRGLVRTWPSLVLEVVGDNRTHPRIDLPAAVRRLGLSKNVRLSGFVDDMGLATRYAAADVVVYLSEYEGFGLPVLEALSRSLPVVTSKRPATGELFHGAALLVEPDDPREIESALRALVADPDLRAQWAQVGRARAKLFSWEKAAADTRQALEEATQP
jgi:glycosyltransferase involved in cell wall biosynthesis